MLNLIPFAFMKGLGSSSCQVSVLSVLFLLDNSVRLYSMLNGEHLKTQHAAVKAEARTSGEMLRGQGTASRPWVASIFL